jgi:SAM-dependent methyltransferase
MRHCRSNISISCDRKILGSATIYDLEECLNEQSKTNKVAWNHRAYEFWNTYNGTPYEFASRLRQNIHENINERYTDLFLDVSGQRILNAMGSNGRKAVPLGLLGAEVTIIDISEENRRYALELAKHADVELKYKVGDFITYEDATDLGYFDIVFSEGGILHYFSDLRLLFHKMNRYLRNGGRLILNDFHPFRKVLFPEIGTDGDYFESDMHTRPVAYESRFKESEWAQFPKCSLRFYTIGEIITAIGQNGFCIKELRELKRVGMEYTPSEFTLVAEKIG